MRGVADTARIAVGGHSYGAFMAANLLAHAPDLFACGIARSGAYNRWPPATWCCQLQLHMRWAHRMHVCNALCPSLVRTKGCPRDTQIQTCNESSADWTAVTETQLSCLDIHLRSALLSWQVCPVSVLPDAPFTEELRCPIKVWVPRIKVKSKSPVPDGVNSITISTGCQLVCIILAVQMVYFLAKWWCYDVKYGCPLLFEGSFTQLLQPHRNWLSLKSYHVSSYSDV